MPSTSNLDGSDNFLKITKFQFHLIYLAGFKMGLVIRNVLFLFTCSLFAQLASADVSGNWTFAVSLGDAGSGNAEITMAQEDEGKMSGTYSGQLANGSIAGTYDCLLYTSPSPRDS